MSTIVAKPIYTPAKNSPLRVAGPVAIRNNYPKLEAVAKDLESIMKRLNSIVQDLGTIAPEIVVTLTVNAAGTGTAVLGTNCPAVTPAAPATWVQVTLPDGTLGWTPVWV
jgi:hypothetical protein